MKKIDVTTLNFEARDGYERSVVINPENLNANAKMQIIRIAPNTSIRRHRHEQRTEVFIIISGNGSVKVGDESISAVATEIILCEPGDVHEVINKGDEPFVVGVFRTNDPGNEDMIWEEEKNNG